MREFACALLLLSAGCSALVAHTRLPPRIEYAAFSFSRPPNASWSLEPVSSSTAVLRCSLPGNAMRRLTYFLTLGSIDRAHSFFVLVGLGGLKSEPRSHEEFAELAGWRSQMTAPTDPRDQYAQSLTTRQGQWCIRVELMEYDPDVTYVLRGYRCLHPARPRLTLDFYWSERAVPGELDPNLYPEAEAIVESVSIDER